MNKDIIKFIAMERYSNINIKNLYIEKFSDLQDWIPNLINTSKAYQSLFDYVNNIKVKGAPISELLDNLSYLLRYNLNQNTCNVVIILIYLITTQNELNIIVPTYNQLDMNLINYAINKLIPLITHTTQVYALSKCIDEDNDLYIKLIEKFFDLPTTAGVKEVFTSNTDINMINKLFIAYGIFRPTNMCLVDAMINHYNYNKKLYTLFCIENHDYITNDGYKLVYLDNEVVEKFILFPLEHCEKWSLLVHFNTAILLNNASEQLKYIKQMQIYLQLTEE